MKQTIAIIGRDENVTPAQAGVQFKDAWIPAPIYTGQALRGNDRWVTCLST